MGHLINFVHKCRAQDLRPSEQHLLSLQRCPQTARAQGVHYGARSLRNILDVTWDRSSPLRIICTYTAPRQLCRGQRGGCKDPAVIIPRYTVRPLCWGGAVSLSEERTCCRPAVELGHEIDWTTATQRRQRLQPNVKDEATSAGFLPLLGLPVAGGVVCYPAAEQVDYANCIDPRVASSDCSFSLFLFFLPQHPHPPPSPHPHQKNTKNMLYCCCCCCCSCCCSCIGLVFTKRDVTDLKGNGNQAKTITGLIDRNGQKN